MEYFEVHPLPAVCRGCEDLCCGDCDHALERWTLSRRDELILRRKGLEQAMGRLQRQLAEVERELALLETPKGPDPGQADVTAPTAAR